MSNILNRNNVIVADDSCSLAANLCRDINTCVSIELTKQVTATVSQLDNFCLAVAKCVDYQFQQFSQGLTNGIPYFDDSLEYYLKSIANYSTTDDLVLTTSNNLLQWLPAASGSGSVLNFSSGDLSPLFTTSVLNPTSNPALSFTLNAQAVNKVFAGPPVSGTATPTFRSLVIADIPDLSSLYQPVSVPIVSFPINILQSATGINTINNGNFGQVWTWNSILGNNSALTLSSSTSGVFPIGTTNLLNIAFTGSVSNSGFGKTMTGIRVAASKNKSTSGSLTNIGVWSEARGANTGPGSVVNFAYNGVVDGNGTVAQFQNLAQDGTQSSGAALACFNGGGNCISIQTGGSMTNKAESNCIIMDGTAASSGASLIRGIYIRSMFANALSDTRAIQVDTGLSSFQAFGGTPHAIVHLGASTTARAPLIIEEAGINPATFVGGEIWMASGHLWAHINGSTYQIDQQSSSTDIYSADGSLSTTRVVNMVGNSITWDNSGLFRIRDNSGATDGVYDFNQGLDFLTYNSVASVNIAQTLATGVHLAFNNLVTPSNSITFDLTATGVGLGTSSPTTLLDINKDKIRVRTAKTPSSASDTGNTGDICWDSSFVYVCINTNTWKRSAISTW